MSLHESAARLSDDLLFPSALEVDRADRVPGSHFEALAREGLYDFDGDLRVVEALASGCLATAFVWLQHHGALASAAAREKRHDKRQDKDDENSQDKSQDNSHNESQDNSHDKSRDKGNEAHHAKHHLTRRHDELRAALASGELKGGIARAGARPGTRSLTATSTVGGYTLNGSVPWVTGWGMVDILEVAALSEDGADVLFFLIDAAESPSLTSTRNQLFAVNASRTVTLSLTGHHVPTTGFVRSQPFEEWQAAEASGSRLNGGLALGVAARCIRLLPPDLKLQSELDRCRGALLAADESELPWARAAASELAMRAAIMLTVQTGSRAVLLDDHAQRLVREAAFLLVFGTRPRIKAALLEAIG